MIAEEQIGFDEYCDRLRIATISYLKAGPTIGPWDLAWLQLNRIALQFGTDGAGRIAHGLTAPDVTTVFVRLSGLQRAVRLDGHSGKPHDIAIFPPTTHFTFVSDCPLSWLAVAVPVTGVIPLPELQRSDHLLREKAIVTLLPSAAERLIAAANTIRAELSKSSGQAFVAAAETAFLNILDGALAPFESKVALPSDYNRSAERIIHKALEYVRARPWELVTIEELVAATEAEYRTLLRAFQRYLNVGPKHYLKLRQLDLVRLALRQRHPSNVSVTNIMLTHGVTEFGRFAAEYKHLFHETPSETFRRTMESPFGQPGADAGLARLSINPQISINVQS